MAHPLMTLTLNPKSGMKRRKHRFFAWLGMACTFVYLAVLLLFDSYLPDRDLYIRLFDAIYGFTAWSIVTLHTLRMEADEIELDDQEIRLHSFGTCRHINYRDIDGMASLVSVNRFGNYHFVADLRSRLGKRIGRFTEDFSDFNFIYDEVRRRLAAVGVDAGDEEEVQAVRQRRKRFALLMQLVLCTGVATFFSILLVIIMQDDDMMGRLFPVHFVVTVLCLALITSSLFGVYGALRGYCIDIFHRRISTILRPGETLEDWHEKHSKPPFIWQWDEKEDHKGQAVVAPDKRGTANRE